MPTICHNPHCRDHVLFQGPYDLRHVSVISPAAERMDRVYHLRQVERHEIRFRDRTVAYLCTPCAGAFQFGKSGQWA